MILITDFAVERAMALVTYRFDRADDCGSCDFSFVDFREENKSQKNERAPHIIALDVRGIPSGFLARVRDRPDEAYDEP